MVKGERLGELEELILLAAGTLGSECSALGVQELLEEEADRPVSMGSVYAALDRVERKGYVRSSVRTSPVNQVRRKRYYDLTDEGLEAIDEAREVP